MHYKSCSSCRKIIKKEDTCDCQKAKRREYKNEYSKIYDEQNEDVVKPIKTARWKRLRKNIIHRDGGYCQRCLNLIGILTTDRLEVHHIKPRSKYPDLIFDPSNLITVCSTCNMAMGTSGELDFDPTKTPEDRDYNIL